MLLGILGACGNKKTNIDPFASITKEVDSIRRVADSIHCDESPEDPQPIQADESFDDFIYNFASDDVLQRQRGFQRRVQAEKRCRVLLSSHFVHYRARVYLSELRRHR